MLRALFVIALGALVLAWIKTRKSAPLTPWQHYVKGWRRD